MAGSAVVHVGSRHVIRARCQAVPMTGFLLVLYLAGGSMAFDDTLSGEDCHKLAEALKEGGAMQVSGKAPVVVETASCISASGDDAKVFPGFARALVAANG